MKCLAIIIALALAGGASPALAGGARDHAHDVTPCGAAQGGLPDPAATAACLADRYKAPKPKPSPPSAPAPAPTPGG